MNLQVIRNRTETERELWDFILHIDYGGSCIWLDLYSRQSRESTRHRKWNVNQRWSRLDYRQSNIVDAPLPSDVESEMRSRYQAYIATLPIKR